MARINAGDDRGRVMGGADAARATRVSRGAATTGKKTETSVQERKATNARATQKIKVAAPKKERASRDTQNRNYAARKLFKGLFEDVQKEGYGNPFEWNSEKDLKRIPGIAGNAAWGAMTGVNEARNRFEQGAADMIRDTAIDGVKGARSFTKKLPAFGTDAVSMMDFGLDLGEGDKFLQREEAGKWDPRMALLKSMGGDLVDVASAATMATPFGIAKALGMKGAAGAAGKAVRTQQAPVAPANAGTPWGFGGWAG